MDNFFSKILKQKKYKILIFLFFISFVFAFPTIVKAAASFIDAGIGILFVDLSYLLTSLCQIYAKLTSSALSSVITNLLTKSITTDEYFKSGWELVRDLSNMLIVLGFVVVGIATTLRIREYEAKKALVPLIIVALLINFSTLFCGLIIDASGITMNTMLGDKGVNGRFAEKIYHTFYQRSGNLIAAAYPQVKADTLDKTNFALETAFYCLAFILIGTLFLYYVFIFIERYIMLGILFMLAPLAFFAWAFGSTKKYFDMWMNKLISWSFVGVGGAFFITIAIKMMKTYSKVEIYSSPKDIDSDKANIYALALILMMLFIGLKFTKKNAGSFANSAMGLVKSAGMFAAGAVTGGALTAAGGALSGGSKMLDNLTGNKVGGYEQKMRTGAGLMMERIGIRSTGTTDAANSERVNKEASGFSDAYLAAKARGDTATQQRIGRIARTAKGVRGAGAMKAISEAGDINEVFRDSPTEPVNLAQAHQRLSYAESVGAKDVRKNAFKKAPMLAGEDTIAIQKIQSQHPGWSPERARREAIVRAVKKVAPEDLNMDVMNSIDTPHIITDAGARMNVKQKAEWKGNCEQELLQRIRVTPPGTDQTTLIQKLIALRNI